LWVMPEASFQVGYPLGAGIIKLFSAVTYKCS